MSEEESAALRLPDIRSSYVEPEPWKQMPIRGLVEYVGGLIYFMDCRELTKIGYTGGRIDVRHERLQRDNPFPVVLWGLLKGGLPEERQIHDALAAHRQVREWFLFSQAEKAIIRTWIHVQNGEAWKR